ncbi:hypothetical protein ANN_25713 [Periplaneta americana]|uniref:Uncharacterized protein n=1 Tax=Periplaneta americana TaxID=6978 RepID=A0ABQ8S4F6_PERAM|nr:hypothetical protein ANN_25713 [Periplaneta americana]
MCKSVKAGGVTTTLATRRSRRDDLIIQNRIPKCQNFVILSQNFESPCRETLRDTLMSLFCNRVRQPAAVTFGSAHTIMLADVPHRLQRRGVTQGKTMDRDTPSPPGFRSAPVTRIFHLHPRRTTTVFYVA